MEFEIQGDYIELIKLLKYANLVESGGEAKMVVDSGLVLVNGEQEYRKRKKLYPKDTVEFDGNEILIKSAVGL